MALALGLRQDRYLRSLFNRDKLEVLASDDMPAVKIANITSVIVGRKGSGGKSTRQ